jgi:hypothetical protein
MYIYQVNKRRKFATDLLPGCPNQCPGQKYDTKLLVTLVAGGRWLLIEDQQH